jgi:enoyl-CoA hydratase/carnithine racemase
MSGPDAGEPPVALQVRLERPREHVAEIVLDRPAALNAISTQLGARLVAVCQEVVADSSVRVVVLSSAVPRAFCVGADLKERNGLTDDELRASRLVTRAAYRSVLDLPMPAIAAVQGFALGGGFELALGCDLIVADRTAVVGLPEVSVGVIPGGGGTQLLARRVGWSRAADLLFTARRLEAAEAQQLGLLDRLVDGDARTAALDLAATIAGNSPVALRSAKRAMRVGLDQPLAAGLDTEEANWAVVAFSADRAEGVRAFTERRPPQWPDNSDSSER